MRARKRLVGLAGEDAPAAPVPERDPGGVMSETVGTLSSREVNFLWWFIQGSIMDPEVRRSLRRGWGLCPRHTAAWLIVEAAFRHSYFHGPAVLYDDLMERARAAFDLACPLAARQLARRLWVRGPCHLCAQGLGPDSEGFIAGDRLRIGRDASQLRAFMDETRAFWREAVCGLCSGGTAPARCRPHLCAEIEGGVAGNLDSNRVLVLDIAHHVGRYHESFRWESRGSDTVEDRAALISAAGWCGGWQGLLALDADGRK